MGAGVSVIVSTDPKPCRMCAIDILQKIWVHIDTVVVAGTDAHNGELFARGCHSAPVYIALIAGDIDSRLEQSHKKSPFPVSQTMPERGEV